MATLLGRQSRPSQFNEGERLRPTHQKELLIAPVAIEHLSALKLTGEEMNSVREGISRLRTTPNLGVAIPGLGAFPHNVHFIRLGRVLVFFTLDQQNLNILGFEKAPDDE